MKNKNHPFLCSQIQALNQIKFPVRCSVRDSLWLNLMENTHSIPNSLNYILQEKIKELEINRYPNFDQDSIMQLMKKKMKIPVEFDVLLGNGSSELIQLLMHSFSSAKNVVMFPSPSFYLYKRAAVIAKKNYIELPINSNFQLNLQSCLDSIEEYQPELIIISNPNNPTANLFVDSSLDEIIKRAPGFVVIDEAYYPYSRKTYVDRIGMYNNLIVIRSFSKLGLAALRLGYLVGTSDIVSYLRKLTIPFNINSFSLIALEVLLNNFSYLEKQIENIIYNREKLSQNFKEKQWGHVYSSNTNFIVMKLIKEFPTNIIVEQLKNMDIYIQNLDQVHPILTNCIRFSVGTIEENEKLLSSIIDIVEKEYFF